MKHRVHRLAGHQIELDPRDSTHLEAPRQVDPDEDLDEVDRTDNGAALVIDAAWWKPDDRIEEIEVYSTTPGTSYVSFSVTNRGPVGEGGPTTVLDAAGGTQFLAPLLPGEAAPFSAMATVGCSSGGSWEWVADHGDLVEESDETNNNAFVLSGCTL